jgi:predicted transcriptional regulator
MNKSWGLIPKILSGEKRIETRWYKYRFAPWNKINSGDTVYFKNSGECVTAKANVEKVVQFENLDKPTFDKIIKEWADEICLIDRDYNQYYRSKNYVILIFLKNPSEIKKPFTIDKTGFGNASVWITVEYINQIKVNE